MSDQIVDRSIVAQDDRFNSQGSAPSVDHRVLRRGDAPEPTLSFVIPAYNEEKLISATIESIHRSVPRLSYEIIVVDNCSTDATSRIASGLGALVLQQRGGTIAALRNKGVREARGEILVFLDADVVLTPQWAAHIPVSIESIRTEPTMITGAWCSVPANASWIERWWFAPRIGETHLGSGHMIIARRFFDELAGFDETLPTGEDYDLSRRVVRHGGRIAIDECLTAEHHGFPRTLGDFIRREAWHGIGDFSSLSAFIRSKVALTTAAFALLHGVLLTSLIAGWLPGVAGGAASVAAICAASSLWKYGHQAWPVILHNSVVFWFYYLGRSLAVVPGLARIFSSRSRA